MINYDIRIKISEAMTSNIFRRVIIQSNSPYVESEMLTGLRYRIQLSTNNLVETVIPNQSNFNYILRLDVFSNK
jgi:hypothetical protein